MAECEIVGYRFAARVDYRVEQQIPQNRSAVHITGLALRSLWTGPVSSCWVTGTIYVNENRAAEMILTNTDSCAIDVGQTYSGGGEGNWSGFSSRDIWVEHSPDGNAEVSIRVSLNVFLTNQRPLEPGISGSVRAALPRIPRVTELTAQGVELGQEMTIRLNRAAAFTDTVVWRCGAASGAIAWQTGETELRWSPALILAEQVPDSETVPIELEVTTYAGQEAAGSRTVTVNCRVPDWVVPTAEVTVTDDAGYAAVYGRFVQHESRVRVQTAGAGAYGSRVAGVTVHCGRLVHSAADACFVPEDSGSLAILVTVTDSRGRSCVREQSIQVLPYWAPWALIQAAYRCDSSGNAQADGTNLRVDFTAGVTALPGATAQYWITAKNRATGEIARVALEALTGQTAVSSSAVLPAGIDDSYECTIEAGDSFHVYASPMQPVGAAFVLMDFCRETRAAGIGIRARSPGMLSLGMDLDANSRRVTNLPPPQAPSDAATKEYVDAMIAWYLDNHTPEIPGLG